MRTRFLIGAGVALVALVAAAPATADIDPNGYTVSKQPQMGTCGNEWATATMTRTYTLKTRGSRQDVWTISYSGGFQTRDGALGSFPSPGACLPPIGTWTPGVSVIAGVHGQIDGFDTIHVPTPGTSAFNPLGVCQAGCNSAAFVAAFYPPSTQWYGKGPGIGPRFHFSRVSPYLSLLCRSDLYAAVDMPGFTWSPGFVSGDIATTC